jgi:hypothetical protein
MVAPLLLSLALTLVAGTACSGSSAPRAATQQPTTSASASPPTDDAASVALSRAEAVVTATRSFTFNATEVLSGDASHATSVRGSVVRGQGVSYVLVANGRTSQVVRIAGATYVRPVPGKWSKLRKPRPVSDPAGTLLAVLRGLTQPSVRTNGAAQVVEGSLPTAAAKAAQLPAGPTPARVQVTLDAAGHVTKLVVTTASGSTQVTLTTSYAGFGRVKPLKPPV